MRSESDRSYQVKGKLEIPYRYYAGEFVSKFLTTLRDRQKILGCKCPGCGKVFVPPRTPCSECFAKIDEWVELPGTGTVQTFTVVRGNEPHYKRIRPYALALIKMDGADTAMAHFIGEVEVDKVKTGMKVQAVFADKRNARITDIKHFKPV